MHLTLHYGQVVHYALPQKYESAATEHIVVAWQQAWFKFCIIMLPVSVSLYIRNRARQMYQRTSFKCLQRVPNSLP